MVRVTSPLSVGLLAGTVLVAAPQNPPTFRAGVELIQLDVSVLDHARRPVTDLDAGDFTVLVDGQPRPVVAFKAVTLAPPLPTPKAAWVRDVAPDVVTNVHPSGRVVVIAIDDGGFLQVDPPSGGASSVTAVADLASVKKARQTARAIVDQLGPDDMAAVVFTTNGRTSQDFTRDRDRLRTAIDKAALTPSPSRYDARFPDDERPDCVCGLCSIEPIDRVIDALAGLPEQRKILMYISAGVPVFGATTLVYDIVEAGTAAEKSQACNMRRREAMLNLFRHAAMANVTVQSIDPKGIVVGAVVTDLLTGNAAARVEFMRAVAENTGGRAVVNNNSPDMEVPALLAESSSYYLLGVESPGVGQDGQFHSIAVKVNRPGVDVRTRKGYYDPTRQEREMAAASPPTESLDSSIRGVVAKSDLPLGVSVAPFATADGQTALAIAVNISEPAGTTTAEGGRVSVIATALDPQTGKNTGEDHVTLQFNGMPADPDRRYDVLTRLPAKAGRYQVRVGVQLGDTRTGSVYASVDVPDFGDALSLSGLVLSALPAPLVAPKDKFADLIPAVPTARRAFSVDERVTAFLRIYQRAETFAPATINLRLTDTDNQVVAQATERREGARTAKGSVADLQTTLPISTLTSGEYLLTVDVTAGGKKAQRALRFAVQ